MGGEEGSEIASGNGLMKSVNHEMTEAEGTSGRPLPGTVSAGIDTRVAILALAALIVFSSDEGNSCC